MKLIEMNAHLCLVYMEKLDQKSETFQYDLIDLLAMSLLFSSCNKIIFLHGISLVHNLAFINKSKFIIDHVWDFFQKNWSKFLHMEKEGFFIKEFEAKILLSMYLIKNDLVFLEMTLAAYKQAEELLIAAIPYTLAYRNYHFYKGRAFLENYKHLHAPSDIIQSAESLKRAYEYGGKNNPEICCLYGEVLIELSELLGDVSLLRLAIKCSSNAIFLTSGIKSYSLREYEAFWIVYIFVLKKQFDLTHTFASFDVLIKALEKAKQELPGTEFFSLIFGEATVFYGVNYRNVYWIEVGLAKLTSLFNKSSNLFLITALFARGISNLGLFIENPGLIKEGKIRIKTLLKYMPDNVSLLNAFGENYYCLGKYFEEKKWFRKAIDHFRLALQNNPREINARFNLAKTFFEQGKTFDDAEATAYSETLFSELSLAYPDSVLYLLFWSKALFAKAKNDGNIQKSGEYAKLSFEKLEEVVVREKSIDALFLKGEILLFLGINTKNVSYAERSVAIFFQLYSENYKKVLLIKNLTEALFYLYNFYRQKKFLLKIIDLNNFFLINDTENDEAYLSQGKAWLLLSEHYEKEKLNCDIWKGLAKTSLNKALGFGNKEAYYYLACLYASESSVDKVVFFLKKSLRNGYYVSLEVLQKDCYLKKLKDNEEFKDFLIDCERKGFSE